MKKEAYNENLINKFGQDQLKQEKSEFQKRMEEGGFTLVMDHTGGVTNFEKNYMSEYKSEEDEKPKKKNNKKEKDDFYRFQVKNQEFAGKAFNFFYIFSSDWQKRKRYGTRLYQR